MEFQHAKMTYVAEVDNNIRYYRGNLFRMSPIEKDAMKQLIAFLTACKQMDLDAVEIEKVKLKNSIRNMLYDALESGLLGSKEFTVVWTTTVHQTNMFYNKCHLLNILSQGVIGPDDYKNEEKKNSDDMIHGIQEEISLETLEILVAP